MRKPKNCNRCKLATHSFINVPMVRCFINAELRESEGMQKRPSWCPLDCPEKWANQGEK